MRANSSTPCLTSFCDMSVPTMDEPKRIMFASKTARIKAGAFEVELATRPKVKATRPPMFKVVMLNDDYTPMDFVVSALMDIFRKSSAEAASIMMEVHHKGAGVCGIYTRDVAETKADLVISRAQSEGYPLQCLVEPDGAPPED